VIKHLGVYPPPLLQGEMMIIGTRTLWPYGPGVKTEAGYVALPVNNFGGVGGTMWSKKPSFLSNI